MVGSIHVGHYGGCKLLLMEGPLMIVVVVVDVLIGNILQGPTDSDINAYHIFWDGYRTYVWDP